MCDTEELLERTFQQLPGEKAMIFLCQRREEETEEQLMRVERKHGVSLHKIYGEDFVEAYLQADMRRERKEDIAV